MKRSVFLISLLLWFIFLPEIIAQEHHLSSAPSSSLSSEVILQEMDKRVPLPLLPHMANHQKQNMREHLQAVQGIIDGLSKNDFKVIEEAASKMGYTDEMAQMCKHLGAGAEGFTELAIRFHKTADKIAAAARRKNGQGVLHQLNIMLSQCTGCHATYKQQVVDETTYRLLTEKTK